MFQKDNYPKIIFLAFFLATLVFGNIGVFGVREAGADPYFNSAEAGCNPSSPNPNYLMCDDFEDGDWFVTPDNPGSTANDGWLGVQTSRGTPLNPPPPATSCGAGVGAVGTNCAAVSIISGGEGGGGAQGLHGFYPNNTAYNEVWIRFYIKFSSGYVFNNNQKFFSLIPGAYDFGIVQGGIGRNLNMFSACPQWTCGALNEGYLTQNLGNNISMGGNDHWYFVEWHIKINTFNVRNGIFEMWIDDCGTSGLLCSGTPTLRESRTNVGWIGGNTQNAPNIGSLWIDIWGNPADVGTIHLDQFIVAKAGPIGFMGAGQGGGPLAGPPIAPGSLTVK